MRKFLLFGLVFILVGCSAPRTEAGDEQQMSGGGSKDFSNVPLEDLGPAPELNNTVWLNTDAPLRLADLHGKVVLLDMWTFG